MSIRPFNIAIEDTVSADVYKQLEAARLPDNVEADSWIYGAKLQ